MWRQGRGWYERIWPACPRGSGQMVAIDATPAYHVWYNAPRNMAEFFGLSTPRLRLVWMLREPVGKFWSYFWELKMYGGEWDKVSFAAFGEALETRTFSCPPCLQLRRERLEPSAVRPAYS